MTLVQGILDDYNLLHNDYCIGFVGDKAEELERFLTDILIPMRNLRGNKNYIPFLNFESFIAYADFCTSVEHVLLVLDQVRVVRHPAAGLHHKAAHGEVGAFFTQQS